MPHIVDIDAIEILDSRGNPTVMAKIITDNGIVAKASVPSGASTGEHEAIELRDGDKKRYGGKGVLKAIAAVKGPIKERLLGKSILSQREIDTLMIEADGTENKSNFGANAILAVSLASAKAKALAERKELFTSLGDGLMLPCPMLNIINGGAHADNSLDFQEFMIRPFGFQTFSEALRAGSEIYWTLKSVLKKRSASTSVGDEGGFAPNLSSHEEAIEIIIEAIEKSGYKAGTQVSLALDCAANELFDSKARRYNEKKKEARGEVTKKRDSTEQIDYLENLIKVYPIDSIEDGLAENDWEGWKEMSMRLGDKVQLVGDDIFVTNPHFLHKGISEKIANSILIKLNQIGTVTETVETIAIAKKAGYRTIISHRSGETEDSFIADLAVAVDAGQIKTGAPCRSDRVAKYNRLLYIEHLLGEKAVYRDSNPFARKR